MDVDPRHPAREPRFPAGYRPKPDEIIPMPDWVMRWRDGSHPVPEEWRHLFPDEPESPPRRQGWRGAVDWLLGRA